VDVPPLCAPQVVAFPGVIVALLDYKSRDSVCGGTTALLSNALGPRSIRSTTYGGDNLR
jgi:hypothetical protein